MPKLYKTNTNFQYNTFFSSTVSNLNTAEYKTFDSFANQVSDPVLKAIIIPAY